MFSPVADIIRSLESTTKRNEKLTILEANSDNHNLKEFFRLTLDPYISFYSSTVLEPTEAMHFSCDSSLFETLSEVNEYSDRDSIKKVLQKASNLVQSDPDYIDIVHRIINKDPSCGVSHKTVLKVWPGLVHTFDVMKAEDETNLNNVTFPAYVEDKIDGCRAVLMNRGGKVSLHSSSGREFPGMDHIKEQIKAHPGMVLDGELVKVTDDGFGYVERRISNGEANKALNGNLDPEQEAKFVLVAFDFLTFDEFLGNGTCRPIEDRREALKAFQDNPGIDIINHVTVHDHDSIDRLMKDAIYEGKEGIMVKSYGTPYEPKRSKYWTKLKKQFDGDFRVVNLIDHTKKPGMIGAIECETSEGLVRFSVGSGLTDAMRKELYANPERYIDEIVTVAFHDMTEDEEGNLSLYLPRVVEFREDKTDPDSADAILALTRYKRAKQEV